MFSFGNNYNLNNYGYGLGFGGLNNPFSMQNPMQSPLGQYQPKHGFTYKRNYVPQKSYAIPAVLGLSALELFAGILLLLKKGKAPTEVIRIIKKDGDKFIKSAKIPKALPAPAEKPALKALSSGRPEPKALLPERCATTIEGFNPKRATRLPGAAEANPRVINLGPPTKEIKALPSGPQPKALLAAPKINYSKLERSTVKKITNPTGTEVTHTEIRTHEGMLVKKEMCEMKPDGIYTTSTYSPSGILIQEKTGNLHEAMSETIKKYDSMGRLSEIIQRTPEGCHTENYDEMGRVVRELITTPKTGTKLATSQVYTLKYDPKTGEFLGRTKIR